MVKLLLTTSLAEQLVAVLESLQPSSRRSLSPTAAAALENVSSAAGKVPSLRTHSDTGRPEGDDVEGKGWIYHTTILSLYQAAESQHRRSTTATSPISLYSLLKSTQPYFKPKPVFQRVCQTPIFSYLSPIHVCNLHFDTNIHSILFFIIFMQSAALQNILDSIQLTQDRDAYDEMISTSPPSLLSKHLSIASSNQARQYEQQEWRAVSRLLTLIANILFSVFGTTFAIHWLLTKSYHWPFDSSLLLSFSAGMVVFMVELFLYWTYF